MDQASLGQARRRNSQSDRGHDWLCSDSRSHFSSFASISLRSECHMHLWRDSVAIRPGLRLWMIVKSAVRVSSHRISCWRHS